MIVDSPGIIDSHGCVNPHLPKVSALVVVDDTDCVAKYEYPMHEASQTMNHHNLLASVGMIKMYTNSPNSRRDIPILHLRSGFRAEGGLREIVRACVRSGINLS